MEDSSSALITPPHLTVDRLDESNDLILAQSTSQFCRFCCFQPSINWVLAEQDNYQPGENPFYLDSTSWIHEESTFCGRSLSFLSPGCRSQKYVQHAGPPPDSIRGENQSNCCTCQIGPTTTGLTESERNSHVTAIHEKAWTCGTCCTHPIPFPICSIFPLPYLETRDAYSGNIVGKTSYVCDSFLFVPKYDVTNSDGEKLYHIRPDTCFLGMCIRCRRDGNKGKCCRVPFVIRDPVTHMPFPTHGNESVAQIDGLWTGWANECCMNKNAYHLTFPQGATANEKLILTGSAILIDVTMFEQNQDD